MHGDGDIVFSKDFFQKPRRVTLMPEGDDEMGDHLMTKWCAKEGVCCFQKRIRFKICRLSQPYMRNHSTLIWERALLIT